MAINRSVEERALDKGELELVSKSHHPELQEIDDKELSSILKLTRERRDKAQSGVNRRKREMRGKSDPKGTTAAASADGNKTKLEILSTAVRRLNAERTRRQRMAAKISQADLSRNALRLKEAASEDTAPFTNTRHAYSSMENNASGRREHLGQPMERGRLRKAAAVAQAKRDAR